MEDATSRGSEKTSERKKKKNGEGNAKGAERESARDRARLRVSGRSVVKQDRMREAAREETESVEEEAEIHSLFREPTLFL